MSKKKVMSLSALCVLAVFIVCSYISYIAADNEDAKDFMRTVQNYNLISFVPSSFEDYGEEPSYDFSQKDMFIYDNFSNQKEFPIAAGVFDENKKLIAKDSPYIKLTGTYKEEDIELYCSLSEYLKDDDIKDILDKLKKVSWDSRNVNNDGLCFKVLSLDYNLDKNRIIPVEMEISGAGVTKSFHFSDDEAMYHYENTMGSDDFSKNDFGIEISYINFDEALRTDYRKRTYDKLTQELLSFENMEYINNYEESGERALFVDKYDNGSETFYFVFLAQRTPVLSVLASDYFRILLETSAFICLIILAAVLIAVSKFYDKNKRLEDSRKAFINAAAHELKTPLAVISNNCECIMENVSPEKNESYVDTIYNESKRMTKLTQMLINYNKVLQRGSIEKNKADLSLIVQRECEKYRAVFESKKMNVQLNTQPAIIKCNENLIALAVDNFLSNAAKYGKENTDVILSVTNDKNSVKFSIYNESDPIPDEALPHIWEELYRVDKTRNSKDNSTGMGLAINRQIFEIHKFKYDCRNINNGVEFSFKN